MTFEHSSADPKFAFPSKRVCIFIYLELLCVFRFNFGLFFLGFLYYLGLVRSGKEGNQKWMLLCCACRENRRVFLG